MTRVISFSSGKGGVGKTTLATNLGCLWSKAQRKTLLIDGDWALGKLSLAYGLRPEWTIQTVLEGKKPLSECVMRIDDHLDLLASPSGVMGFEELTEEQRNQLFFELDALGTKNYDRILIDHSSGIHWGVLQFAAAAHQHVVVTTPEPTSYMDAYAIMKLLSKRFAIRDFWLVGALCTRLREAERTLNKFMETARTHLDVRVQLLELIPWDSRLIKSFGNKPFVDNYPNDLITERLERVRSRLDFAEPKKFHGLQYFFDTIHS
ncbi:MAG: AAA family ATPase [Deltaproteobacteria bacterium]|nr:AAA family ATPase [Deltaproteobacteria bacterium]MBI3295010.1 AAA family ATPase [Deltaproteobacteria bacterium]